MTQMSPERSMSPHMSPSPMSAPADTTPKSPSTPRELDVSRQAHKPTKNSVARRAAVACVACRDRKIKCDGNPEKRGEPCLQCKHLNRPCEFRFDDRRKKNSTSKAYIKRLQDHIAALQRGQRDCSPSVADNLNSSEGLNHDPFSGFGDSLHGSSSDDPTQAMSGPGGTDTSFRNYSTITRESESFHPSISNYQMMDWHFDVLDMNATQSINDERARTGVPSKSIEARNHMINQLYGAMGLLDADEPGQLTNLHITSFLPPSSPESLESVPHDLEQLADSKHVQTKLLDLYFTYEDPLLQVLQREPFMSDYTVGCKTQYHSNFLLYSVLLNALRLTSDPSIRSLDRVYLSRAKQELVSELENPTIATIQALCIFGDYRGSGLGNDKACLIYPGIAFRMLYDLALNRDATDLMAMGYLSDRDLQVRHNVFWGCYVYDKFHSIYLGRPSHITLADVTVPRPSSKSKDPQSQIRVAWSELCTIISDVIDLVNGPSHLLKHQSANARRSSIGQRLLQWVKELPIEVQWRPEEENLPCPGIYALHMQFYTTIIMLHRPCAAYTTPLLGSETNGGKQLAGNTPVLSRQLCNENAVRVAKLLLSYKQHYGIKRAFSSMLHMIFLAATTLISHISTDISGKREDSDKKWLAVCLQALSDLEPCFHIAGRVHKVIASFIEGYGYSELAPLANTDLAGNPADQQQRQLSEKSSLQRQSHPLYPTNSIPENHSEAENISDTTLAVSEFGLYQAMSSHNPQPTVYSAGGGLEGLLNMDSYQNQSYQNQSVCLQEVDKTSGRTPQLEMNFLCT